MALSLTLEGSVIALQQENENCSELLGQPLARIDAPAKVTGEARFPGDLTFPGMLHAKVLFAERPAARILRLDTRRARNSPGVERILTAADVPSNEFGIYTFDQPVLAAELVRSLSDPVALVIAQSDHQAEIARDLIEITYEPLPAVFDPWKALKPDAPLVHPEKGTNLLAEFEIQHGNIAQGMAESDLVVEMDFQTPANEHAYLQPEAGVGLIDEEGRVTVYVGAQWIQDDVRQLAHVLNLPKERIREVLMPTGGAFGGREDISLQCLVALAAYCTGHPVKLVYSREESIRAHGKRHPFFMHGKIGVCRDGRILAMEVDLVSDAGAYTSTSTIVLANAVSYATGPYDIPNVHVRGRTVLTHNISSMAMRGFGSAQTPMLCEALVDEAAHRLGLDPVAFRLPNLLQEGSLLPTGSPVTPAVGITETLRQAAGQAGWIERDGHWTAPQRQTPSSPNKRWGRGLACVYKNVGYSFGFDDGATVYLEAEVSPSGDIQALEILTAATDSGQGLHTALCQIAACTMGIPLERVRFAQPDTARTPNAGSNSASRQVFVVGRTVLEVCRSLRERIERGEYGRLHEEYRHRTQEARPTTDWGPDGQCVPHQSYAYVTNLVELEVDLLDGRVEIRKIISAQDIGRAINRQVVLGQLMGGVVMGQGFALFEEFLQPAGRILTGNLGTYIIPSVLDIPLRFEPLFIESVPEPAGPYGAKGFGELSMIGVAPAILNALRDALGMRLTSLPASPERVLQALAAQVSDRAAG